MHHNEGLIDLLEALTPRFFDVCETLSRRGVLIKSETWNTLVKIRGRSVHWRTEDYRVTPARVGAEFRLRYKELDVPQALEAAMTRLGEIIRILASEPECKGSVPAL